MKNGLINTLRESAIYHSHSIPSTEYIISYDTSVVTDKLLFQYHTTKERKEFYRWMYGQTWMITDDGKAGYYVWDYERWLAKLPIID